MQETENLLEILDSILENIRSLEDAIVKEVETSKTETESVLKQLATYLNITAQSITELQKSSEKFSTSMGHVYNEIGKIDGIENKVLELPQTGFKIKEDITNTMDDVNKLTAQKFNQLANYIKKLGMTVAQQNTNMEKLKIEIATIRAEAETSKNEILTSQDKLLNIIYRMISSDSDISKAKIEQGTMAIGADAQKHKAKMQLWQKIIAVVAGSGGILYFIINMLSGLGK